MRLSRPFRSLALVAASAALLSAAAPAVLAATPAPIPVTVVQDAAVVPFSAQVSIYIAPNTSTGSANYNPAGAQTIDVPAGKRLVVQGVSMYRASAVTGSSAQVFLNATLNGLNTSWPTPLFVVNGSTYPGIMQPMTVYADGGTKLLLNGFRDNFGGGETLYVAVTGYLVNMP
jgi:hypothetical protein